jgi:hypothetical protein
MLATRGRPRSGRPWRKRFVSVRALERFTIGTILLRLGSLHHPQRKAAVTSRPFVLPKIYEVRKKCRFCPNPQACILVCGESFAQLGGGITVSISDLPTPEDSAETQAILQHTRVFPHTYVQVASNRLATPENKHDAQRNS